MRDLKIKSGVIILSFFLLTFYMSACGEKKEESAAPEKEAVKAIAALPEQAVGPQRKSSELYMELFNDAAGSLYGFSWVKDEANPSVADAEEILIPAALKETLLPNLAAFMENTAREVNSMRRDAVKKALDAQEEIHLWFDLKSLSEPYQKAARYLVEASYYLHELYKLQMDANFKAVQAELYASNDLDSIRLFTRNAAAFCGRYGDPKKCAVLPDFYAPEIGGVMWPKDMNTALFEEIRSKSADPAKDPLLSPFTVVKRDQDGKLQIIAYGAFEPFRFYLEKISSLMEQASDVQGVDLSFAAQLKAQAKALLSSDPRPFFESDSLWGISAGELELVIGPYETYEDPYGTKAFYEMMLGAEDKAATDVVKKFMPLVPEIEQRFALNTGGEVYKAREIKGVPPLRVVNVIIGSGEMKKAGGPSIALSLPNIGPMVDEGRAKRVIFANHHEAKYRILKSIADIAIVPEQLSEVDPQSFVFDSTFHEIMHGIGPQRETPVGNSTVALQLGGLYDGLEEAKANVGGVWAAKLLADKGVITWEQLKAIQTTYVAGLLRIMRFGAKEAHAKGAAFEFSYLFSKGAMGVRDDRLFVDHDRMQAALDSIMTEIGTAMAKGDKAAAGALLEGYPARAPTVLDDLAKRFAGADIPRDVAIVYHVKN